MSLANDIYGQRCTDDQLGLSAICLCIPANARVTGNSRRLVAKDVSVKLMEHQQLECRGNLPVYKFEYGASCVCWQGVALTGCWLLLGTGA